ncbi:MAG TPA: methyltransferase, partial [Cyclobacteriaceae bacterium]|nr:methyltransferase [Cyclobacteriaceae bacterium]
DSQENSARSFVERKFDWVKWVEGPKRGPAANRNNGAKYARGQWLVFIDDDVIPADTLLAGYSKAIEALPPALAFEGAILPDDWALSRKDMAECPVNTTGGLFWSANICVNKALFDSINGFDEQFKLAAQEDQDLYERLKRVTPVRFISDAKVVHAVRITSLSSKVRKIVPSVLNWYGFAKKNNSTIRCCWMGFRSQLSAAWRNVRGLRFKSALYNLLVLISFMPIIAFSGLLKVLKRRTFQWVSSIDEVSREKLKRLEADLTTFYSGQTRGKYNQMISSSEVTEGPGEVSKGFLTWFETKNFTNILEVGCGTGRIRAWLPLKDESTYTGIEVSAQTISQNASRWPGSKWKCQGVYDLDTDSENRYDLIFSFYVLEHLAFPRKALEIMYAMATEGGSIVVVCPDFCETRRFPSQFLGLSSLQSAQLKLRKFRLLDAVISFYDSRVKLRQALKGIQESPGRFMVNVNPICLSLKDNETIWPDCDAVYLASKVEIENWAREKEMKVAYPAGKSGIFREHSFVVLTKKRPDQPSEK